VRCLSLFVLSVVLIAAALAGCDSSTAPPSTEKEKKSDLLSDEELFTDPDPNAANVDTLYANWIGENYIPIRSLTSSDFSDLQFLKLILKDRKLVQLGESGHGVSEFDMVKVRLIKFLHQEMGFDVIAFESSLFECFNTNENAPDLSPLDIMRNSIFGVWHAQETLALFEYIKSTQGTARPLILAGFDIQMSSYRGVQDRPQFLSAAIDSIDHTRANWINFIDSSFVYQATQGINFESFINSSGDAYAGIYQEYADFVDANIDTLLAVHQDNPLKPLVARQTAWSMTRFIAMMKVLHSINQYVYLRDEAMAANVDYLVESLYPNKKIAIWAHNFHIRHDQSGVQGDSYGTETMGTYVAQRHRPDLYTVGLYMYRGQAAYNDRNTYRVGLSVENSVEAIFYQTRCKFVFLDMMGEQQNEGNEWMFGLTPVKTWGVRNIVMKPRDQYDAILFIDTVHPPDYIEYVAETPAFVRLKSNLLQPVRN
jgi:erythromycin esterase